MPSAKTMPDYYDESPIAEHADKPEIKTAGRRVANSRKTSAWSDIADSS